jgi:PAS domain S-box-containing protein
MKNFSVDINRRNRILNFEFFPLPLKPQWQVMASIRDVTMERYRERDFKRIEDQYNDLIENAIDAMYILKGGRFLLTNRKFQEMLGYTAEELFNRHYRHFITRDAVTGIAKTLRGLSPNDFIPNLEIQTKRKDGTPLILEISVGKLKIDDEDCFVGMVRDITSKKELLGLKTRFLHVASHEIRVPLTVLRGYVRMLAKDETGKLSTNQQECISEIERHCEKLINFTNTLLDYARINSGKLVLSRQQVDIYDLVRHVVHDMQIKADERGVSIVLEADACLSAAYLDPLRIEQALTNLIDNAIKHSPENGVIRVKLDQIRGKQGLNKILKQDTAEISVIDSGPGIRAEEANDLFSEFFVGTSGKARRGIGLGLAITKEIIHAHGGMIEARPSDEGGIFVITIPLNTITD